MLWLLCSPLLIAGAAVWMAWGAHNRLVALDQRCDTAFADVDVMLKHRHDLIPGLVETVRGYAAHERNVLTEVTRARASALQASGPDARLNAEMQLGQSINTVLSLQERYPDLAASAHFRELRMELVDATNRITAARRYYNLAVEEYNATLRQFPGNIVGEKRRLSQRRPVDIGVDRVLMDEPVAIQF